MAFRGPDRLLTRAARGSPKPAIYAKKGRLYTGKPLENAVSR